MGTLTNFIANTSRTKLGKLVNNKDQIRANLADFIISEFDDGRDSIRILTLPSAIWNFEKLLIKKLNFLNKRIFVHITACERNRKIFSTAAINIPNRTSGLKYFYKEKHNCDVVSSRTARLYCTDVFNYVENTENKFDFIWMDLVSPLNIFIEKLIHIDKCTKQGSIVCVTFLRARDGQQYIGKREEMVTEILNKMGFVLQSNIQYFDTSPMLQLTYKRI
jgi:hypothetical protein